MRWAAWQTRSKTASANVGSAIEGCHLSTGSWLATTVERSPERSSTTSNRSRQASTGAGLNRKSSSTRTPTPRRLGKGAGVAAVGPPEGQVVQ